MTEYNGIPLPDHLVEPRYRHPFIDRLTGKYRFEWDSPRGKVSFDRHNRLTDFEGRRPSWGSRLKLPQIVLSYLKSRSKPLLDEPVPFLVTDAVEALRDIVKPGTRVLEIGGGNSTLWFLNQGANVTTIEHSREWGEFLSGRVADRPSEIVIKEGDEALALISSYPDASFDLILVDCMNAHTNRSECIRRARQKVKPGGWLVLDNSDNPNNWDAKVFMQDREAKVYTGYAYMCLVVCQTTFWRM